MELSTQGTKYAGETGISRLMEDLGRGLAGGSETIMLGGGNPAIIPEVAAVWRRRMEEILADGNAFDRIVGIYDTPQGRPAFLSALARMLNAEFGWGIGPEHIAVTNGSQSAFFVLYQLFAGRYADGSHKKILFPLLPEYIGYADQTAHASDLVACRPTIERRDSHRHKYHIDFDRLRIGPDIAAVCASRPTNPTGNVLTDEEITRLDRLARDAGVPLLIDNAYGTPFPDIIFTDAKPVWNENIVLSMSLSKIGLPSLRTGILIASPEIVQAVSAMNAVLSLSTGTVGQALTETLLTSGELLSLARNTVRPFYRDRRDRALDRLNACFAERFAWSVHEAEGSLFLWIWFPGLPATTSELYERLMRRGVVVVPGTYFFFGNEEPWEHRERCIRVNYGLDPDDVARGIEIIGEEVQSMWERCS